MTVGYDEKGKQLRKTLGLFSTKQGGVKALIKYKENPSLFKNITFKELKNKWWERKVKVFKNKKSLQTAIFKLNKLEPLSKLFVKDLNLIYLQNFFDDMQVSNQTKKGIKSFLNQIFDYALKFELINQNKINLIELGKNQKIVERRVFNDTEIKTLWSNKDVLLQNLY